MKRKYIIFLLILILIGTISPVVILVDGSDTKRNLDELVFGIYGGAILFLALILASIAIAPKLRKLLLGQLTSVLEDVKDHIVELINEVKKGDFEASKAVIDSTADSISNHYFDFLIRRQLVRFSLVVIALVAGLFGSYLIHKQTLELREQRNLNQQIWDDQRYSSYLSTLFDQDKNYSCPTSIKDIKSFVAQEHRCMKSNIRARQSVLVSFVRMQRNENTPHAISVPLSSLRMSGVELGKHGRGENSFLRTDLYLTDFSDAYFVGAKMNWVSFESSDISGANFQGGIFSPMYAKKSIAVNANFSDSILSSSEFTQSNLKNSVFTRAKLYGVDFEDANLEEANFTDANITKVNFENAILVGAVLSGAYMLDDDGKKYFDPEIIKKANRYGQALFNKEQCKLLNIRSCKLHDPG